MSTTPLAAFAEWTAQTPRQWPDEAITIARRAFVDIVACMVPGSVDAATQKVQAAIAGWGDGVCTLIGFEQTMAPPWAALVNGTAAHALDFDDNFDPAKAHATAVLVPAILAVAQARQLSGFDALDAYVVGLQIMGLTGQGVNPYHRSRGWHATATVGTVGAAAAVARLMRLNGEQTAHALSVSTSLAGGFMSQFGTMTKPVHAGFAAYGGVMAGALAEQGLTAGQHILDGPHGMGTLMVGPDVEALRAGLVGKAEHGQTLTFATGSIGEPLHIVHHGLKIKRFPNCGSVHRALDGLLDLRERHQFSADQVARVDVYAPAAHLRNLMYERPIDGKQAKFSLEYCLAVGLLSGNNVLSDFDDRQVGRDEVRALLPLVHRHPVEKLESEFPTQVQVTLKDGTKCEISVEMPVGSRARPLTDAQVYAKLHACIDPWMDSQNSQGVEQALRDMATSDTIAPLMAPLSRTLPQNGQDSGQ